MSAMVLAALLAVAAPRTPYGGELVAVCWGHEATTDPRQMRSVADLFLAGAIYEPLYRIDEQGELVGVLASGAPVMTGDLIEIPLRPAVTLHDGTPLAATRIAEALRNLGEPQSAAQFVLMGVSRAADGTAAITAATDGQSIRVVMAHPYVEWPRLLASPRASIAVTSKAGRIGSGPFKLVDASATKLVPHTNHRDGRPFIDAVRIEVASTPFAARARLSRGDATIAFGLADAGAETAQRARPLSADGPHGAEELIIVAVGKSLRRPAVLDAIDASLNRRRLSRRYFAGAGRVATTLFGGGDPRPAPAPTVAATVDASLLVAPERAPGLRFAERVQLDLLRAGVRTTIERVTPEQLDERRTRGDYELLLDTTLLDPAPVRDAADRLHRLLAVASVWSDPSEVLSSAELLAFGRLDEPARRARADALEQAYRQHHGLVPVAVRPRTVWVRREVQDVTLDATGIVRLEQAFLP